jgi:histone H2A
VAAIYIAAVLEYLTAEILEMSGHVTRESKKAHIQPRHILIAIKQDEEFNKMLRNITICEGGVVPSIKA